MDQQIPLGIKLQDQAVFESYFSGNNIEVVEALRQPPRPPGGVIWLWGAISTGKSHLLQALSAEHKHTAYFPLQAMRDLGVSVLKGFGRYRMLGLDDVDSIVGDSEWEQEVFNLFNELVFEQQSTLVVSSRAAPRTLEFTLSDLASRLLSGPVYRLEPLNDVQLLQAIQLRAHRRGLELPEKTGQFLLNHFQRDMASLCQNLDKLDTASLVHQRKLTIPLIKATLSI